MAQALSNLIGNMSASIFILIAAGIALVVTELYQPSKRVLGIAGAALIVTGVVMQLFASKNMLVVFLLIFIVATILLFCHFVILFTQKKEWLTQAQATQLALHSPSGGRLGYLKNMTGIALTDIESEGSISINEVNFNATAKTLIEKGSFVRVIRVGNDGVEVERFDPEQQI